MQAEEKFDGKTLKLYAKVASNQQDRSPIVAYYLTSFAAHKGIEVLQGLKSKGQDDPELGKDVQSWFMQLEDIKRGMDLSDLNNTDFCKKQYHEYMINFFLRADNKYRDDDYSPQLAQDIFYSTALFDGYSLFDANDAEVAKLKKYSKVARLKIMKAIKSGNLPVPKRQQQKPSSETEIPEEKFGGPNHIADTKINQSRFNNPAPFNPQQNNTSFPKFDQPFGGGNQPQSTPIDFNAGGLPDFTKFGDAKTSTGGGGNLNFDNLPKPNNSFGTGTGTNPTSHTGPTGGFGGFGGGNQAPRQPRRGPEFYQKTEKAKDLCKKALGELEYKRVHQYRENLEAALAILESLQS